MFTLFVLFVFAWLFVKSVGLAFHVTWGLAKFVATLLFVIALPLLVVFAVVGAVVQTHGAGLDGDAAFAFKLHGVENLVLHLALFNGMALLQQTVGQRGFAVVNVGDDRKIADMRKVGHVRFLS